MKNVSYDFQNIDDAAIASYQMDIQVRANAETVNWRIWQDNTGKVFDASYGWQGNDTFPELSPGRPGDSCITAAGTLLRLCRVSGDLDTTKPLYLNRVLASATDPAQLALQLTNWQFIQSGVNGKPAISATPFSVSIWYINSSLHLCRMTSIDDGYSWSSPVDLGFVFTYTEVGIVAAPMLAAGTPNESCYLVITQPHYSTLTAGGLNVPYCHMDMWVIYWNGSVYIQTLNPRPLRYTSRLELPTGRSENVCYQLGCDWVDGVQNDKLCITLLEDPYGVPASCVFQGQQFSDFFAIQAIDFAEPGRNELMGLRLTTLNHKLICYGLLTLADTDFMVTITGVLFYSDDGMYWSDAYYVTTAELYNWGKPLMFQGQLCLVGIDSIIAATPTTFWGGTTDALTQSLYTDMQSVAIDVPEEKKNQPTSTTLKLVLDNTYRQWTNHPLLQNGCEIQVIAGYTNTLETVTLFQGTIEDPAPKGTWYQSTFDLNAIDYLAQLKDGQIERVLHYPYPVQVRHALTTANDLSAWSTISGNWTWDVVNEELSGLPVGYMRPTALGLNEATMGTGLAGYLSFAVTLRNLLSSSYGGATYGNQSNFTAFVDSPSICSILWAIATDHQEYYALRWGATITGYQLVRANRLTSTTHVETVLATATAPGIPINWWHRIFITQIQSIIIINVQTDGQTGIGAPTGESEIIRYIDSTPLNSSGLISVACTMTLDAPTNSTPGVSYNSSRRLDIAELLINGHEPPTLADEYLGAIGLQRGLNGFVSRSRFNDTFQLGNILDQWIVSPIAADFVMQANGLLIEERYDTQMIWMTPQDPATGAFLPDESSIAIDVTMQFGIYPGTQNGNWGVVFYNQNSPSGLGGPGTYAMLTIGTGPASITGTPTTVVTLQTNPNVTTPNGGLPFSQQSITSLVYIAPWHMHTYRFIAQHGWFAVYCNQSLCAMFYDDNFRVPIGGWCMASGSGLYYQNGGQVLIQSVNESAAGLVDLPILKPGDTYRKAIDDIGATLDLVMHVEDRVLMISDMIDLNEVGMITNDMVLSSGYQTAYTGVPSHVRVTSVDPSNVDISGTVYAIERWQQYGKPIWQITAIKGLRNEAECRARATLLLQDAERAIRTRSYTLNPILRYEKNDAIYVQNTGDDTDALMTLTSMHWDFRRDESAARVLTGTMNMKLIEQQVTTLTMGNEYQT